MNALRGITFLDIKDVLTKLVLDWRNYLSSKLQDFVNMLLFKVVGYTKEQVRIHFDGCWLEPREFTVHVTCKARRSL